MANIGNILRDSDPATYQRLCGIRDREKVAGLREQLLRQGVIKRSGGVDRR